MRGASGTGNTVISESLLEHVGAIRLLSDVERKRLHALAPTTDRFWLLPGGGHQHARGHGQNLCPPARTDRALQAGFPVIVDATFLKRGQRESSRTLAQETS